jgi:flagellar biosynthetic protein FliR
MMPPTWLEPRVLAFLLVLTRVTTFLAVFPLLRLARVPNLVKVAFSLALTIHWLPLAIGNSWDGTAAYACSSWLAQGLLISREIFVGGTLGYLLGLFFLPARIAGAYISQEMGLTLASIVDPSLDTSADMIGDLLNALSVVIFLGANLHYLAFGTLLRSFTCLPLGFTAPHFEISHFTLGLAEAHTLGLHACGRIGAALFLVTIIVSVQMKLSPQLNLFTTGSTLRVLWGLVSMTLFLPDLLLSIHLVLLQVQGFVKHLGMTF